MTMRRAIAAAICIVGAAMPAQAAYAESPDVQIVDVAEDPTVFQCGDLTLSFASGTAVLRTHNHQRENGQTHEIISLVFRDAVMVDQSGTLYRVVGSSTQNTDVTVDGDQVGRSGANLTILDDSGVVGSLHLGFAYGPGDEFTVILHRATCAPAE